ncbi:MAG: sulfotransferase [Planctomycetota bacterium]|nr:sulfotransferase [Planctomycetota bacterium]
MAKADKKTLINPPREWTPRIWQGCSAYAWWRLLIKNRFSVSLKLLPIAIVLTHTTLMNTLLGFIKNFLTRGKPGKTPLEHDPVFILGHWRTGTTLLHELLILDPAHKSATTLQCMTPSHTIVSAPIFKRLLNCLVPSRRPMDNMASNWDLPQEDEFALALLGLPSPYLSIAFPNNAPTDDEAFELDKLSPKSRARWNRGFLRFLREISWKDSRRLVLKSPPHTFRVKHLLKLFPRARFVHILRDPYVVFPSTVNLWKTLQMTHGVQVPRFEGLEDRVFNTFVRMHKVLDEARPLLNPNRFVEIKYEELVAEPMVQLEKIYSQLQLGDFAKIRNSLQKYLDNHISYQTNQYKPLEKTLEADITRLWGDVITKQGYPLRESSQSLA